MRSMNSRISVGEEVTDTGGAMPTTCWLCERTIQDEAALGADGRPLHMECKDLIGRLADEYNQVREPASATWESLRGEVQRAFARAVWRLR
jgi:hypothetical protein